MAAMTTALTVFSDKENARTYTYTGHSVQKPKKVLQRRKEPGVNQEIIEDQVTVYNGAEDSSGGYLDPRITFTVTIRRSKNAIAADVSAALATFRDIVAGDEFTAVTTGSAYLK